MRTVICPGSFDPITLGHLDIITRSSALFDRVIVLVMTNYSKIGNYSFTSEERIEMIKRCISDLPNVEVDTYDGLRLSKASEPCLTLKMNFSRHLLTKSSILRLILCLLQHGQRICSSVPVLLNIYAVLVRTFQTLFRPRFARTSQKESEEVLKNEYRKFARRD